MKFIFRKFRLPEDEILTLPFLSEVPPDVSILPPPRIY